MVSYNCVYCNVYFTLQSDLKKHVLRSHERKNPWQCQICSAKFRLRSELRGHKKKVHDEEKKEKHLLLQQWTLSQDGRVILKVL